MYDPALPPGLVGALIFVIGCCIGSFLNVCIWRLPRGQSISKPRCSVCPKCQNSIRGYDNIPLLSYLLLLGRCRYCKTRISWRYPLVEGVTGVLFLLLYLLQGAGGTMGPGEMIVMGLLISLLIAASGVDMEFLIIPDEVTLFGLTGALTAGLLLPHLHTGTESWHTFESISHINGLLASAIGAASGGGIVMFFAITGALIFRREAIGFGDVKLMAMIGAFTGWRIALATFAIAPFIGLFYGIPMLLARNRHAMPFGPFLAAASIISILFRSEIGAFLNHYMETIGMLFELAK